MKRFSIILTLSLLITSFFFNTADTYAKSASVKLQIDNPIMTVDGAKTEIDPGNGTRPVIIDGRTLVPIRAIIETFGGSVAWDGATQTVTLKLKNDTINLVINSTTAWFNGKSTVLDVAPAIINERTMLPIRFVAEKFGLQVDWNGTKRIVSIIKSENLLENVPPYTNSPCVYVNGNQPRFSVDEISDKSYEYYSALDNMGRCSVCIASIGRDIMPTGEREKIGYVKPTGWHSVKYDNVDGKYLYNRCHLIGYQLTAENANEENLITGTRYMNVEGMLPFENMVADYIKKTGNNVMYRATPVFEGDNMLASGVLLEAYSVEDKGKGISFCVYCYNVQPGINIDYKTGASSLKGESSDERNSEKYYVLNTSSKKFHYSYCTSVAKMKESNKAFSYKTRDAVINDGYAPCGNCNP